MKILSVLEILILVKERVVQYVLRGARIALLRSHYVEEDMGRDKFGTDGYQWT